MQVHGMPVGHDVARPHTMVIMMSDDELAMLRALANDDGVPMAVIVRAMVKKAYRHAHGDAAPPAEKKPGRKPQTKRAAILLAGSRKR